ncbi:MAG: C25 family cysteine peptidase [Burkholderiaceae bacterium]
MIGDRAMATKRLRLQHGSFFAASAAILALTFPPSLYAASLDFEVALSSYALVPASNGSERIVVENFGPAHAGGLPSLPGRTYRIELPVGAEVSKLEILYAPERPVSGIHRVEAVPAEITDRAVSPRERAEIIAAAVAQAATRQRQTDGSSQPFPPSPLALLSVTKSYDSTAAHVRYEPFRYNAKTGELSVFFRVVVRLHYARRLVGEIPSPGPLVGLDAALTPLPPPAQPPLPAGPFNYVIVVPNNALAPVFADFVAWKERLGHRVVIIDLPAIGAQQLDRARRLRSFLSNQLAQWGIRYVLLIGDLDAMPGRLFYPDQQEIRPFLDDFYFSNLRQSTWDGDGDNRWGEFGGEYDARFDVAVGRIPFSDPNTLKAILSRTIAFEMETGARKREALLAAGVYDLAPTDSAITAHAIKADVLLSGVWKTTTLYQTEGTKKTRPANVVPDQALSDAQYWSSVSLVNPSLILAMAHGNPDGMRSYSCIEPSGNCDATNQQTSTTDFGQWTTPPPAVPRAVVYLNGCSTAAPVNDMLKWNNTVLLSLLDPGVAFGATANHNAKRYLASDAVAVIASTAGMDYANGWSSIGHGGGQTLSYLFYQALIRDGRTLGEGLAAAQEEFAKRFGLKRGIRVFQLFGDPSLVFDGVSLAEPSQTSVVYKGEFDHFAGDYDSNGDLFVAVARNGDNQRPSRLQVMRSTDNGRTWQGLHLVETRDQIRSIKAKVNRLRPGEFATSFLHVFVNASKGTSTTLWDYRFALDRNLTDRQKVASFPAHPGGQDRLQPNFSVARTPDSGSRTLVVAYSFTSAGADARIRVGRSLDNGANWRDWKEYRDFFGPVVDVGVNDNVFIAACRPGKGRRIAVARSADGGGHWQSWQDLPQPLDALAVCDGQMPALAASSDPARPSVWVAFDVRRAPGGMIDHDIDLAVSPDNGANWSVDAAVARNLASEHIADIQSYKTDDSRWVNVVYTTTPFGDSAVAKESARINWRWSSGSIPERWSNSRLVDSGPLTVNPAQVLFAPSAAGSGSGVLYGKPNEVRFSASWL